MEFNAFSMLWISNCGKFMLWSVLQNSMFSVNIGCNIAIHSAYIAHLGPKNRPNPRVCNLKDIYGCRLSQNLLNTLWSIRCGVCRNDFKLDDVIKKGRSCWNAIEGRSFENTHHTTSNYMHCKFDEVSNVTHCQLFEVTTLHRKTK